MSDRIRFIMLGGFLGAGKTTLLAQMAARYKAAGKHVCIVTNDQAADLVDTQLLKNMGFDVAEVAGSCFCCNFNGLTSAMDGFAQRPDIILAEPVGSCTDLIATIAMPMMEMLGEKFDIAPYAVVLKPSHGLKILSGTGKGFSPQAEYIFRKQLEEAELLIVNRIDELSVETVQEIERLLREQFPDREILKLSAKTGEKIDELIQHLERRSRPRVKMMEVDYDIYAEGEAELGWLNATVAVTAEKPFALDQAVVGLMELLHSSFGAQSAETAHLKIIGQADGNSAVANLVSSDTPVTLSLPSHFSTKQADLIVNARVAMDPGDLRETVEAAIVQAAKSHGFKMILRSIQSFKPGRPVPTYRTGV